MLRKWRRRSGDGGVTEYNYSSLGYLVGGTLPTGTTFSYSYDGVGRRIQRTVGSATTRNIYRDGLHPVAVLDGNGALLSRFVFRLWLSIEHPNIRTSRM